MSEGSRRTRRGVLAPELAAELPGLCLLWTRAPARSGRSSAGLQARLAALAGRDRGADLVALRTRPLPAAYRALFRQLGMDPDIDRVPAERLALARLMDGGLRSGGRIVDACRIALAETAVGVWALDAAAVAADGPAIRVAGAGEPEPGALVVADADTVHAPLFGEPLPGSAPRSGTRAVVLYAIGAPGVAEIHLDEALWQAADALEAG